MTYAEVFGRALGSGHEPYQYQADLAQAETLPSTVVVPTGLGKDCGTHLGLALASFLCLA